MGALGRIGSGKIQFGPIQSSGTMTSLLRLLRSSSSRCRVGTVPSETGRKPHNGRRLTPRVTRLLGHVVAEVPVPVVVDADLPPPSTRLMDVPKSARICGILS